MDSNARMSIPAKRPRTDESPTSDSTSTQPQADSPPIKWHELHSDPLLDIVLVSKNQVYFRASSHALKRESSLFAGMLSMPPHPFQSVVDAIPLDFSATALAIFLDDYCTSTNPSRYDSLSIFTLHDYLTLLRYLDCDRFLPHATEKFQSKAWAGPLAWLVIASRTNDIEAASAALARCLYAQAPLDAGNVYDVVARVHESWHLPLLKALFYSKNGFKAGHLHIGWPDAERVAAFVAAIKELRR